MTARRAWWIVAAVVVVLVGLWWAWPSLTAHDRTDVLVVDDGLLAPGREVLDQRTREDGRSVTWQPVDDAWCTDPAGLVRAVDALEPAEVVLGLQGDAACATALVGALHGRDVVAVADPTSAAAGALTGAAVTVVDPTRLVGAEPDLRLPCQWWEQCDGDGRVGVRGADGTLTPAGLERVARMVVAAL